MRVAGSVPGAAHVSGAGSSKGFERMRDGGQGAGHDPLIPVFHGGGLRPYGKLAAHREGLRHPAVSVFVMRGGLTLIQRRALAKYHTPGLWANSCCTHPHWNGGGAEETVACAARRLDEELGLTGLSLRMVGRIDYRADVGGGLIEDEAVEVFAAEAPPGMEPSPNPDEVAETRWIGRDALLREVAGTPERFTPWLRIYLRDHADMIFG